MMDDILSNDESLPLPALERIEKVCLRFEAAWKQGDKPRIEEYLDAAQGVERGELLRELLLLDLDYCHRSCRQPTPDEYRTRFPQDSQLVSDVFDRLSTDVAVDETISSPAGSLADLNDLPWVFGDYELLEEIAHGGMGVVYKARQTSLNRIVAVKMILRGQLAGEAEVKRFHAEAEVAARLQHPGIVAIHEVGVYQGQHYFSMDYIQGRSLAAVVRESPLPARRAAEYVQTIAEAVHYAHEQGILHRDLKPSNVLIDSHDQPQVTDFGLAKRIENDSDLTATGDILGTASYMSPEQASGRVKQLDRTTDVYALGAILYELLTGRPPFRGPTVLDTLDMVRQTDPIPPHMTAPHIPRDLDTICLKCLEKDLRRRYTTAEELADELRRYQRNEPIHARPVGSIGRLRRWCRRNPLVATLTAAVAASLLIGAVVSGYYAVQANARARDAVTQGDRADRKAAEANSYAAAAEREKELAVGSLYIAHMTIVQQHLERQRIGPALSLLESYRTPDEEQDLRGFEWYYFWNRCHGGLQKTLRDHDGVVNCIAYHPDGSLLASGDSNGLLIVWDTVSLEPISRIRLHRGPIRAVAFSPNGSRLASGGADGQVCLWDTRQGQWQRAMQLAGSSILSLAFSPDSSRLVCSATDGKLRWWSVEESQGLAGPVEQVGSVYCLTFAPDGQTLAAADSGKIRIWDLQTGQLRHTLTAHRLVIPALAFSPDGQTLAAGGTSVQLWELATGAEKETFDERVTAITSVAYSSDGRRLAWGCEDGTVKVRRMSDGEIQSVGHNESVTAVAFSPAGRHLASASSDRTTKVWYVTGDDSPPSAEPGKRIWTVAFSPDGRFAASGGDDRQLTLWDTATGEACRVFPRREGPIVGIAFSPDSRLVACSGDDAKVKLWDCETGEPVGELLGHGKPVYGLAFSPDGTLLASASGDQTVRLWELASGELRATLEGHHTWVWRVAFTSDGRTLATIENGGAIHLWDVARATRLMTLPVRCRVNGNAIFLSDNKTIAVADSEGVISLWDTEAGIATASLSGDVDPKLLCSASDGRTLASCNEDGSVTLWDLKRRQLRVTLRSESDVAVAIDFSRDGKTLVTGSDQGRIAFWRAASESEVAAQTSLLDARLELARRRHARGKLLETYGHQEDAETAYREAAAVYDQIAQEFPDSTDYRLDMATNCTRLAWLLIERASDRGDGFQESALWARRAVELQPENAGGWFTLGVALYRSESFAEALPAFQAAVQQRRAFWGHEWFYLAMTMQHLGRTAEAQQTYRRALGWLLAHSPDGEEAIAICGEAAECLNVPPHLQYPPQRSERCADLPEDLALFMDFEPDTFLPGCCRSFVCELSGQRNYGALEDACLVGEEELESSFVSRGGTLRLEKSLIGGSEEFTIAGWLYARPGTGDLRLYSEYNRGGIVFEVTAMHDGAIMLATWNEGRSDNWLHSTTPPNVFRHGEPFFLAARFGGTISNRQHAVITVGDQNITIPSQIVAYNGPGHGEIGGSERAMGAVDNVMLFLRALSDVELQQIRSMHVLGSEPVRGESPPADEEAVDVEASSAGTLAAVDLLAAIDPEVATFEGTWKRQGEMLECGNQEICRLQIPYSPPDEYDLCATVRRVSGDESIHLGLVVGGRQVSAVIDGWPHKDHLSGLHVLDGKGLELHPEAHRGRVIAIGQQVQISCLVRRVADDYHVRILCDDREILDWQGGAKRLGIEDFNRPPNRKAMYLYSWKSGWEVTRLDLVPVSGAGQAIAEDETQSGG